MKDLCIVGFGLAGLSVARHAELSNLSFDIISDNSQLSSKVAGGVLNPIAVKRMKPVWKVEVFLDYAKFFYQQIQNSLNVNIYQELLLKVFIHNIEQENNWYEAYDKLRIKPFLNKELIPNNTDVFKTDKFGSIYASMVNLALLFNSYKNHYESNKIWKQESFEHNKLVISKEMIEYNSHQYKHIVFCEGFGVTQNPYFKDLGIYGNKGDYLIIKSDKLQSQNIIKAKHFLIPLGNQYYKFGATYQRHPLNHVPSNEAKATMIEALEKMINVPYTIAEQVCGIRPTTRDRRPVLGTHKNYKNVHLLNGFGSRGVMLSPKLGKDLIHHIFQNKAIDDEVSIQRFYAQT
jgi:glycine/D-amino acid oxidase-like deaminating enzyme